jgi:Peptidase family M28
MTDPVGKHPSRSLLLALALLAAVLILALVRREPPDPKPVTAPAAEVSGGRAREVLRDLLGDGSPHPTGSAANARVRDRIAGRLRGLGYTPMIQQGFVCNDFSGNCAHVENVVARLEGTRPGGTVLLMAHYDSVPAGPGASDDLAGVAAVLEVARALKAGPPLRSSVTLLLEDGEEVGLLGAKLFRDSPLADGIQAIVNLEARGTSGPSLMFESIGGDAEAISRFGMYVPHPVTSSVFAAIYKALPNDTDLTVFKGRRIPGLNFAFIGQPTHYHTPLDNFANTSPASLQHHADNAMAAVRGFAGAGLARRSAGEAVFFDLFGIKVLHWPERWELAIALLALLLVAVAVSLAFRSGLTGRGLGFGLLAFLGAVVLSTLVAFGMSAMAQKGVPVLWVAHPLPLVAAFWLAPLAAVGLVAAGLGRHAGFLGLWAGAWLVWSLLGVALVLAGLPKISYLFVIPALIAGAAGLAGRSSAAGLLPALVAGALWFPIVSPLYDGLGAGALLPIAFLIAILLGAVAPFFAAAPGPLARGIAVSTGLLALLLLGWSAVARPFSRESPQAVTIHLYQDADNGRSSWILDSRSPLSPAILRAAPFASHPQRPYPWAPEWWLSRVAPAAAAPLPGPDLTIEEDALLGGRRRLRLRLSSRRGASNATVLIPVAARVESVRAGGYTMTGKSTSESLGWYRVGYLTLPPQGAELEVITADITPREWYVFDSSPGLPASGAALLKVRGSEAVPGRDGDTTQVSRKIKL